MEEARRLFREHFDAHYMLTLADQLSSIGLSPMGFRPAGTAAAHQAAELVLAEMERIGLKRVHKEGFEVFAWGFKGAELSILDGPKMVIKASSFPPAPGTTESGLTAELVDVGNGTAADYLGKDVKGKIAFVRLDMNKIPWYGVAAYEAELHGAAAIVLYNLNGYAQHGSGKAITTHDGQARPTIPIIHISRNDGEQLTAILEERGPVRAKLCSYVDIDTQGKGYNLLGEIGGRRYPERFIIVQAHYDAWFKGYWDNAIGVGGILAIAKALIDSGYEPAHTLIFAATDAEEFGLPDTRFDWLLGAQRMIESHPLWLGNTTCALNIDTLAAGGAKGFGYGGPLEMLPFLEDETATYHPCHFAKERVEIKELVTDWTETYSYAYFGIPCIQPFIDAETKLRLRETIYHTQFDDHLCLDEEGSAEIASLFGELLISLDQRLLVPYGFTGRSKSLLTSLNTTGDDRPGLGTEIERARRAIQRFEEKAVRTDQLIKRANELWQRKKKPKAATEAICSRADEINQRLREAVSHILKSIYCIGGKERDTIAPHAHYWHNLRAIEQAIAALERGEGDKALAIITDKAEGIYRACYAPYLSYLNYHRYTSGAVNRGRRDLLWGQGRALEELDCWVEVMNLQDKLNRGISDFGAETCSLRAKREEWLMKYRQAVRLVEHLALDLIDILPEEGLRALSDEMEAHIRG
jgi:Iap family predicted aminopeptidase